MTDSQQAARILEHEKRIAQLLRHRLWLALLSVAAAFAAAVLVARG